MSSVLPLLGSCYYGVQPKNSGVFIWLWLVKRASLFEKGGGPRVLLVLAYWYLPSQLTRFFLPKLPAFTPSYLDCLGEHMDFKDLPKPIKPAFSTVSFNGFFSIWFTDFKCIVVSFSLDKLQYTTPLKLPLFLECELYKKCRICGYPLFKFNDREFHQ